MMIGERAPKGYFKSGNPAANFYRTMVLLLCAAPTFLLLPTTIIGMVIFFPVFFLMMVVLVFSAFCAGLFVSLSAKSSKSQLFMHNYSIKANPQRDNAKVQEEKMTLKRAIMLKESWGSRLFLAVVGDIDNAYDVNVFVYQKTGYTLTSWVTSMLLIFLSTMFAPCFVACSRFVMAVEMKVPMKEAWLYAINQTWSERTIANYMERNVDSVLGYVANTTTVHWAGQASDIVSQWVR